MGPGLLALALLSGDAHAYSLINYLWPDSAIPLSWYLADIEEDSISWDYAPEVIQSSFDNWVEAAPCASTQANYSGLRDHNGGFNVDDELVTFSFEDQEEELEEGVLAATYCDGLRGGIGYARSIDGEQFYYNSDCDIVYSSTVDWVSTADVESGLCSNEYALEATTTHEIGHLWGLGHSCDDPNDDAAQFKPEGVSCDDPDLANATMFWQGGPCEADRKDPTSDDIEGMYTLYGPTCDWNADEDYDRYGGAPLEVCFESTCAWEVDAFEWDFGDDSTSDEANPCHTYTEAGQYAVGLYARGDSEVCGSWDATSIKRAYVIVCGEPGPAEGFEGMFSYEQSEGLIYQMVNQVDTSVYGCIDSIQWDVFKGSELINSVNAWAPKIEFPSEGEYKVILNVGGPGGLTAAEITIDVVEGRGGCSVVPLSAGVFGLLAGLGAAVRRRRDV